jgi:hypothetical protein
MEWISMKLLSGQEERKGEEGEKEIKTFALFLLRPSSKKAFYVCSCN